MEQNLSPGSFGNMCPSFLIFSVLIPMRASLSDSQASLMACIGLSIRGPASLPMKPLSPGGMSSCIFFPHWDSTQTDPVYLCVCQLHQQSCEGLFHCLFKMLPQFQCSETECSLIVTASMIKAPVCTHGQGCPFLCIGGRTEMAPSISSISFTFSLMSESSHGFDVLGSQEQLVSNL